MKMDRLKTKLWAKLLAAVLLFVFGIGFIAGAAGVFICDSYQVYYNTQNELQKEMDDQMLTKYSVQALADYNGKSSRTLSPNYHYAIYEGGTEGAEGLDGVKVAGDLEGDIPEDAVIHQFSVTDDTEYQLAGTMFGNAYVQSDSDHYRIEQNIQQLYYCVNTSDSSANANATASGTVTQTINENTAAASDQATVTGEVVEAAAGTENAANAEAAADAENAESASQTTAAEAAGTENAAATEDTQTDAAETPTTSIDLYVTGSDSADNIMFRVLPDIYRIDTASGMVWLKKNVGGELGVPASKVEKITLEESDLAISPYVVWQFMFDDYYGGQLNQGWFRAGNVTEGTFYTVVGTVSKDLVLTGKWKTADFFEQSRILLGWLYRIRYISFVLIVVCFLLCLALFVFLMRAAGHRETAYGAPDGQSYAVANAGHREPAYGQLAVQPDAANGSVTAPNGNPAASVASAKSNLAGSVASAKNNLAGSVTAPNGNSAVSAIRLRTIDRVPMDLAFFIVFVICASCAVPVLEIIDQHINTVQAACVVLVCLAAAYVVALEFCMSLAVNIKVGGWWERTIICRIWRLLQKIWKSFRQSVSAVAMGPRIWALFALFVVFEFIGIVVFEYATGMLLFCWLAEKIIFFVALAKILKEYGAIKQAGAEIAGGNLDYKVETENMFTDVADLGNSLNTIGDGLAGAVDERMKSERMKTELITNVSHDIKTPLTSIINYTDLLTKLDLQDPTAREYLEVLGRQSARLKKLIEDLIEASKASSGTLKLEMETINASMLLMQAVGEYEEKFSQKGLDLRVTGENSEMKVRADSRYLWRVFDNLMNNMLKYAQTGTRAYIDLISEDSMVKIIFRNISEMPLHISGDELMERFVRGDSSRSTEGSGLGLSIADSLLTLMGAKMEIVVDGDLFKVIVQMQSVEAEPQSLE